MLGQKRIQEITHTILSLSSAHQTEVLILASDSALTRFANSTIHQNVAETDAQVRVRVVLGDGAARVGVASTNRLDDQALEQVLETATAIARLQPENPDFPGLPGPQSIPALEAFSEATAGCTPEQRARGVGAICLQAREVGLVASGALTTAVGEFAVVNSLGISAYHVTTSADINITVLSDTSAGYAEALVLDVTDLDFEALGREAVDKCVRSQNPRALEPGAYTVILEPYATQDLVAMMGFYGFNALAVQEGRSFMTGQIGRQLLDPRVSIWDDGLDPAGIPMPFDFEGVPKQRVALIDRGVARGVVYDSYRAAREEGVQSTGHALPAPNTFGPVPTNLFLGTGDATVEEMIQGTERGLYITYFHYTRPVDHRRLIITGMTRNGTFLIENGEIAYPVKNLRYTQGYLEALNNLQAIGREAKLLPAGWGISGNCVPALKLEDFSFTGATEF
jgi:PmbA protein